MGDYSNAVHTAPGASGALQSALLPEASQERARGRAPCSPLRRPWGRDAAATAFFPQAHQLQVGVLADLGRTQWVSSVNCGASGRPNVGLGGKLVLVLSRGHAGRGEEAGPHADRDLVHQGARVGGIGGCVPRGALGGEEMGDGAGGAQRGSRRGGGICVQMRLAWQVSRGWGQVWVPCRVQWAAMLEGVGGLRQWGHKGLLPAGGRVAASLLRGWS